MLLFADSQIPRYWLGWGPNQYRKYRLDQDISFMVPERAGTQKSERHYECFITLRSGAVSFASWCLS